MLNKFWSAQNLLDLGAVLLSWLMKRCNPHWFSRERGEDDMHKVRTDPHSTVPSRILPPGCIQALLKSHKALTLNARNRTNQTQSSKAKSSTLKSRGHQEQADSHLPSISFPNCTFPRSMQKTNLLCFKGTKKPQLTGLQSVQTRSFFSPNNS